MIQLVVVIDSIKQDIINYLGTHSKELKFVCPAISKVSRSVSDVSYLPGKASMLFNKKIDKLDEKRRTQLNKHKNNNLVKTIFGKTSFNKGALQLVPVALVEDFVQ